MKLLFTTCLIALTFSATVAISLRKQVDVLPITPKAEQLSNHFGIPIENSPFGSQNSIQDVAAGTDCDIKAKPFYQLCFKLDSCDMCSATEHCGWCFQTGECLPGNLKDSMCGKQCESSWVFENQKCTGVVKAGKLGNFSPDTSDLVNAELTPPKAKIHTVISSPTVVKTPVLLGHETEQYKVIVEHQGKSKTHQITKTTPIIGEVHQVRNIDVHHDKYVNLETGE